MDDLNDSFETAQDIRYFRTGKYLDEVTGLYYNQARWYDPTLGRFISESPIAPFSEEEYVYCGNDTVNFVDVNGINPWLVLVGDAAAGGLIDGGMTLIQILILIHVNMDRDMDQKEKSQCVMVRIKF